MGRFYDALKEANRSRQNPEGDPGAAEWAELGMNAIAVPPVPSDHPRDSIPLPAEKHPTSPADGLWNSAAEEVLNSFSPPRNGPVARAATVALDQKARLIPHAIDPVVLEHY